MPSRESKRSPFLLIVCLCLGAVVAGGVFFVLQGPKVLGLESLAWGTRHDNVLKLKEREKMLDLREKRLNEKEEALNKLSRRMRLRQMQWQKERSLLLSKLPALDEKIQREIEREGESLNQMARIYEKMEPREAARLIGALESRLAARLMLRLQSYASAQILSELVRISPAKAAEISQWMKEESAT